MGKAMPLPLWYDSGMAEFTESVTKTVNCPYCPSVKVSKHGKQQGHQRYVCNGCGRTFTDTGKLHGHRFTADQIGAAVRMFYSGTSYKQIAEYLEEVHDVPEPSKATIYEWVRDYTDKATVAQMKGRKAKTGKEWVADEMMVDVGGQKMWLWNVMDSETRYILASHLTPRRDANAARVVLRKAALVADAPPKTIVTDKLKSYIPAVKDVLPETRHMQSEGITADINNNLSERLQGTFRSRVKTLRGLDSRHNGPTLPRRLDTPIQPLPGPRKPQGRQAGGTGESQPTVHRVGRRGKSRGRVPPESEGGDAARIPIATEIATAGSHPVKRGQRKKAVKGDRRRRRKKAASKKAVKAEHAQAGVAQGIGESQEAEDRAAVGAEPAPTTC